MNLQKHLQAACVPESLHAQAITRLREADKLWNGTEQAWYPISGHELRAPLTWSVLPGRG